MKGDVRRPARELRGIKRVWRGRIGPSIHLDSQTSLGYLILDIAPFKMCKPVWEAVVGRLLNSVNLTSSVPPQSSPLRIAECPDTSSAGFPHRWDALVEGGDVESCCVKIEIYVTRGVHRLRYQFPTDFARVHGRVGTISYLGKCSS